NGVVWRRPPPRPGISGPGLLSVKRFRRDRMRPHATLYTALWGGLLLPSLGCAQGGMSKEQYIKVAQGGAPVSISANAAVARIDVKKKAVTELRAGTNGARGGRR